MARINEILTELREARGLTQLELSKMLHISNSSISAYETGQRVPNIEILIHMSEFFDVSTDFILGIVSSSYRPSVFHEDFVDGTSVGAVINSMQSLSHNQKTALMLVIENMRFCAEVSKQTEKNGAKTK